MISDNAKRPPETMHLVIPGSLDTPTGGYRYDRRIIAELRERGWRIEITTLAPGFPFPDHAALAAAETQLAAIPDGARVLIDGLALGAMPALVAAERQRLCLIGLVHHPLALETGLSAATAADLRASERAALGAVHHIIVTSPNTRRELGALGVPPARVSIIAPGVDRPVVGSRPPPENPVSGDHGAVATTAGPTRLLCVAAVTPRKGHRLLVEALAAVRGCDWHLTCIGSLERDVPTAADLRRRIAELGLRTRVALHGVVDDQALARAYANAELFVLPSHYEGYGMAFAEAMMHGLPVLACRAGAVPDTVPATAGLLVEPGNRAALTEALTQLLGDPRRRQGLAAGAREAAALLPDWPTAARDFAAVLTSIEPGNSG
jgi:glycosyltransferase involved in cell wall biosynthesis